MSTLARHCVFDLARRLQSPGDSTPWAGGGLAGIAIFYGALDGAFPNEGWDRIAHGLLERGVGMLSACPALPTGALDGVAGVAAAALLLSRGGTRYQLLLRQLDALLRPEVQAAAADLSDPERVGLPVAWFDVVSGLAGVGRYLLSRGDEDGCREDTSCVAAALANLFLRERDGVPAWHTPDPDSSAMSRGVLNCGMAHGAAGPLAFLALYRLAGHDVPGLIPAIEKIAEWLAVARCDDTWGPNWPAVVPLGSAAAAAQTHNAWCYGAAGVARALWLAGSALDCQAHCNLALAAMDAVCRRPASARLIYLPCLCHGVAGIVQVLARFAADTGLARFRKAVEELSAQLLAFRDTASPFGFRDLGHDGAHGNDASLLNGAAGIGLALLTITSETEPVWDRLLMLS